MNKILKRILCCIAILLVFAALLYFVPWPTRIDQKMTGSELSADGSVLDACTVTVKGWKLNYLFQEDQIKLETFRMDDPVGFNLPSEKYDRLNANISEDFLFASWFGIDTNNVQYVTAFFATDNSWLLFESANRRFAVSVDGEMSPEDIWKTVTSVLTFN